MSLPSPWVCVSKFRLLGHLTHSPAPAKPSQGTKFALAMYIIALLFKLPFLFLLFKSYVLLSDGEGSNSPKVLRNSSGAVSSPLSTPSHYDVNSPYDPAPVSSQYVASPSGVEMTMMGTPKQSRGPNHVPPPPVTSPYGAQPPLPPSVE